MNTAVAARIKTLREQRGMTQEQPAAAIGTKQASVSRFENVNLLVLETDTPRKLARALGVRLKISFEDFGSLPEVEHFNKDSLQRVLPAEDARPNDPGASDAEWEKPTWVRHLKP